MLCYDMLYTVHYKYMHIYICPLCTYAYMNIYEYIHIYIYKYIHIYIQA